MSTIAKTSLESGRMAIARIYTDQHMRAESELVLRGDQARYIGRVLRLRVDDELTLFNGRGGEFGARIASLGRNEIGVRLVEFRDCSVESPLDVHLVQGISRGERMDLVMQKATELGVRRVSPVHSEFSVVKLDARRAPKRMQHWRGIATSACEQSGRNSLPQIDDPLPIRNWFGDNLDLPGTRLIMRPGAQTSLRSLQPQGHRMIVLIGPEGGFSATEYDMADAAGFRPAGLGPRVMRTETAALAVLTALQVLYGDLAA